MPSITDAKLSANVQLKDGALGLAGFSSITGTLADARLSANVALLLSSPGLVLAVRSAPGGSATFTLTVSVLPGTTPDGTLPRDTRASSSSLAAANLVTLGRTAVEKDYQGNIVDAHAPEAPTRFAKQLAQIARGQLALGFATVEADEAEEFFGAGRDPVLATGSAGGGALVRDGEGWRVEGDLSGGDDASFTCGATNGEVDFVQYDDRDI